MLCKKKCKGAACIIQINAAWCPLLILHDFTVGRIQLVAFWPFVFCGDGFIHLINFSIYCILASMDHESNFGTVFTVFFSLLNINPVQDMFLHNKDGKICYLADGRGWPTNESQLLSTISTEVGTTSTIRVPTGTSVTHGWVNGS